MTQPKAWADMVRPGILLYGYHLPFASAAGESSSPPLKIRVEPVLSWMTRIVALREVQANQPIGYGGAYRTKAPSNLAVLRVGYGDGLRRQFSSRGRAIVQWRYAPIVGNIAMDITLLDVTGIPAARIGDKVTILGASEEAQVTPMEHARIVGTIPYEILCGIGKRVPRRYV